MKNILLVVSSFLLSSVAVAGGAVSELNGKVELSAGSVNGSASENISGSLTMPLAENWGLQLDTMTGDVGQSQQHGAAAHLFWRDSDKGLIGFVGAQREQAEVETNIGGVEAELYLSRFTVSGAVAEQTGDVVDGVYAGVMGTYYLSENLAISAGLRQHDNLDRGMLEVEYQIPDSSVSFFVSSIEGDGDYDQVEAGVRYYFAAPKSLIRRHREDDPRDPIGDIPTPSNDTPAPKFNPCFQAVAGPFVNAVVFCVPD